MNIVNLTPHSLKIGNTVIASTGKPIRVKQNTEVLYMVNDIPIKVVHKPEPGYLPPVEPNTLYIVSRLVADTYKTMREDFVFPYNFVRATNGNILGCRSLARFES